MKKVLLFGGGIIGAYLIFKAMQKKKTDKATESMRDFATRPVDMRKPVFTTDPETQRAIEEANKRGIRQV
jgi:hypothetical protein